MMFKRVMSLIVVALLMCTVLVMGCNAAAEETDLLQEAVNLGIIDSSMMLRENEFAREEEIPDMLQAVFVHGYGKESVFLKLMKEKLALRRREASRYWFAMAVFYSYCEAYYGKTPDDVNAFMDEMDQYEHTASFGRFESTHFGVVHNNRYNFNPEDDGNIRGGSVWDLCVDAETLFDGGNGMDWRHDFGNWWVAEVPFELYDRVTGEKVLDMDEEQYWNPARKMTVREAAEACVRYWRCFEEPAVKVAYADAGTYDPSIITDELLQKPTTLPYNSCSNLPAEWHGILWDKWNWVSECAISFNLDRVYRQADAQILKDAGLNLARFNLSFSWLQTPDVTSGLVNETRLKQLDEILALCMKNDIHLMIGCNQYQDFTQQEEFYQIFEKAGSGPKTEKEISDFAAIWQMLAHRYAAIPNEYLSFNLYNEIHIDSEEEYERVLGPAVDAIRAESPDRTIVADVHSSGITGESMAKRGVALSYHLYDPMGFCYINQLEPDKQIDPEYMHSVQWPFTENGRTFTASALLDTPLHYAPNSPSISSMRALAEKYGVGFHVGEFGVFGEYRGGPARVRYSDETFFGYYRDMIETFEKEGIGWIMGSIGGTWGLQNIYPAIEGVRYEKVGYYYVDTGLRDFLKSFEGK